jgi:predicted alpha/beta superfamily hydrolase
MKKEAIIFAIAFLFILKIHAQVTFVIDSLPDYTPADEMLFIAGSFNGWDPGSPAYVLEKNAGNKWAITLGQQDEGTEIQFKFTRGNWATVEKGVNGEEIEDRTFTFGNDSVVHCIIYNWADFGSGGESTAAENVSIMDEDFEMPQLNRTRRIWIYLPPDYEESSKDYPVLYMHDGQNLFDATTSYAGEWEVDETLNNLAEQGYEVPIVVGVDNGGTLRIAEYTPWVNPSYGGGQGCEYIDFVVETLKPFVDANYRTLPDQNNTGIMGSSLGGLISHYGAIKNQDIFGKAGLFSPSYWFSDSIWAFTNEHGKQSSMRIYQMIGQMEGSQAVANMLQMEDVLKENGFSDDEVISKVIPNGEHNEALWREQFEQAYLWLFVSYANNISEKQQFKPLLVAPNPVGEFLNCRNLDREQIKNISIVDSSGKKLAGLSKEKSFPVNVSALPAGFYIIKVKTQKEMYVGRFIKR